MAETDMGIPVDRQHLAGRRVHLFLWSPWRDAVAFFRGDEDAQPAVETPGEYEAGDVAVHVTQARERAILNVEELTNSDDEEFGVVELDGFERAGLSVWAIEERLGTDLPAAPATLDPDLAHRLLAAIDAEHASPTPWQLADVTGCVAQIGGGAGGSLYGCRCCGRDFRMEAAWDTSRAFESHLIDSEFEQAMDREFSVQVCAACHAILHTPLGPTVDELMYASRPECPQCAAHRTVFLIRGMPPGPPPPGIRTLGCEINFDSPQTDLACDECGYEWFRDEGRDNRPLWRRARMPLEATVALTDRMRDHLDALRRTLIQTASSRRTITTNDLASAIGIDGTAEPLKPLLSVIHRDCFDRREPSLTSLVATDAADTAGTEYLGHEAEDRIACYHHIWPIDYRF